MSGVKINDVFPSGSWGLGPLAIQWSLKDGDEVDIGISVLGINIDTLSGTISSGKASIGNDVNVLGIVTGELKFTAVYDGTNPAGNGLWVAGQLHGPGINPAPLNHRIVSW